MVMTHFALLLAGLAVLPVDAAKVGTLIAGKEIEIFAECTWPLDPFALSSGLFAPKGSILVGDDAAMLALVLFLAFGVGATYFDFLELAEDQQQEVEKVSTNTKDAILPASRSKQSWPMLPIALAIPILILVATSSMPTIDESPVPCMRVPLHTLSQTTLLALSDVALTELQQLPGIGRQTPALIGDTSIVAALLTFVLIGFVTMRSDVLEMAEEDDEVHSLQNSGKKAKGTETLLPEKIKKPVSWLQYVSTHRRMVSCVVLLISMFASTAATLWEGAM